MTIGQQSYGKLIVNDNVGQAPCNDFTIYEEIQLRSCIAAAVEEEIKVTDKKENKVEEDYNSRKTYSSEKEYISTNEYASEREYNVAKKYTDEEQYTSENADILGTLHKVKNIKMGKSHTGENTEMGKNHTGENTEMEFYQNGELPNWKNPVLLNNDFNNNNDFKSNNDIYTSDFKESEELTLAKYLFKHIKNNNPKAK